jgi:heat-inducible transcriptional repressor
MEERLNNLLRLVVEEFVATAEPVGSQALVDRYDLDISPATVRNWFAELDELGLLMQPHTSGGRVPTEAGYKQYVATNVLPRPAGKRVRDRLKDAAASDDLKSVARELAELSGLATIVAPQKSETYYIGLSQLFGQTEFRDWRQVVLITELLDHLDDTLSRLRRHGISSPQILLGKDSPLGPMSGAVIASTPYGLVGIIGPLRMDYQSALSNLLSALEALE